MTQNNNGKNDKNDKKPVIGITGNTGGGKTTVTQMLAEHGGYALDADALAHKALKKGQPAYEAAVKAFGPFCPNILGRDEEIDRKALGAIVFKDAEKRTQLEQMVHPPVCAVIIEKINQAPPPGYLFYVIDAVLLVEAGLHLHCGAVWLINAPGQTRLSRIIERDSLSAEAAGIRMRSQRDPEWLAGFAQTVIYNDSDLRTLREQVSAALADFRNTARCRK